MESILTSIKKSIGISEEYDQFDLQIIMSINTVLMDLTQRLGVGPPEGFVIEDDTSTWNDFLPNESSGRLEGVKSYISLRVRLLFDPPLNSSHIESINNQIDQLEWTIGLIADESTS